MLEKGERGQKRDVEAVEFGSRVGTESSNFVGRPQRSMGQSPSGGLVVKSQKPIKPGRHSLQPINAFFQAV